MKYRRSAIRRLRTLQHGKVVDRTGVPQGIVRKRHIPGSQLLSVCKIRIIPYLHGPGKPVLADLHISCQVISYFQVRGCHGQRTLNQRLMDMFARPPAIGRVKSGLWL